MSDGCGSTVTTNIFFILALVGVIYIYIYKLLLDRVKDKIRKGIYRLPQY